MFCFQCEQTAGCVGCHGKAGVCGKSNATAILQDELTDALIRLAYTDGSNAEIDRLIIGGLFVTVTNVNFDDDDIKVWIDNVKAAGQSSSGGIMSVADLWTSPEDARSLKSLILFGIRGMAAYAYHAAALGYIDDGVNGFFRAALRAVANPAIPANELLHLTMETGRYNLSCMELLDRANTAAYGVPSPATVPLIIERGPFIVVSGHDLLDLKLLLDQTDGTGVSVYTHGEMLPCHGYPGLRRYPHLKGHFGTAWQNQRTEFDGIPAPILFTTNCLMPPKDSYKDRVYTTSVVGYPGMAHIKGEGIEKDFTPIIKQALALGGFSDDRLIPGVNGGTTVTTGFGHGFVLKNAGLVVDAVKSGAIRHFFLVGGCDGAKPGRNYYTDFVKATPSDTIILTLACGKFRFNDLDLGAIEGLPRLMDMGQCNDAYSAIKVALALAEAFGCGVNDLPLSLVLSWYEQKAVAILLSLLYLGIKNILLGPSLPAFVSPGILKFLVDTFNVAPITTPEKDLARIMSHETI